MFCPNCCQQQSDNVRFCHNCGAIFQIPPVPQQAIVTVTQQPNTMRCPRCGGSNINFQAINNVQLANKHHGCAWWVFVGWWWVPIKWLFFTLPALIVKIFKPKKQKIVNTIHSVAVCQNCGNRWNG